MKHDTHGIYDIASVHRKMGQSFGRSRVMQARAHEIIPGGSHTYAKGDDQYPILAPGFIARGEGCHVWDIDGNEFIEFGMGNRAVGLGHAFAPVVAAARKALEYGCNFTRPNDLEVTCAEQLLSMVGYADMVKFCKDGSDATSGAVRLARAHTGRDLIACCGDHTFFSVDDWFIGKTAMNAGIPEATKRMTLSFRYNDIESAKTLFAENPGQIAAFILEPCKSDPPLGSFLHDLRTLCHEHGALLIFDEMITGFRWHNGGAQTLYDVEPDLSCFGKAMANGFALSALVGKREYMRLGGLLHTDRPRVFLLSTTHGGETHALAAGLATMRVYGDEPVIEALHRQGGRLRAGAEQAIRRHRLENHVKIVGRDCCLTYVTLDQESASSQTFRSLFLQELIKRGILAMSFIVSYSHSDIDIDRTIEAIDGALEVYARAMQSGPERFLIGRPSQPVYRQYNY